MLSTSPKEMYLSGDDLPLEGLQQDPDVRHALHLRRALAGGLPIAPAVVLLEGEMVDEQMVGADGSATAQSPAIRTRKPPHSRMQP